MEDALKEVILRQIQNNIPALILYSVVVIIPVIAAILISRDFEPNY